MWNYIFGQSHLVESVTNSYIPIFQTLAAVLSAFGIVVDLYNLIMYVIFQRVYLSPNPVHEFAAENFGSGTFLDAFGRML